MPVVGGYRTTRIANEISKRASCAAWSFLGSEPAERHTSSALFTLRAVTEVRSMGDAAPSPEHCPLRHFCHGNSIISTGSDIVPSSVHVPPGVGINLGMYILSYLLLLSS